MNLRSLIAYNEVVMWEGKPNQKCLILESIFNPLLPIAIIWAIFDLGFLGSFAGGFGMMGGMGLFMGGFFLLHLMPVWIYLGGVIFAFRKYQNTAYLITDKGIYVSGGIFTYTYEMKPFTDLSHIHIHRGILDQRLGVGDVILECHHQTVYYNSRNRRTQFQGIRICNIPDYEKVFSLIKQLQTDVYADTMYPNDLRPRQNHGYQTEYRGRNFK